MYREMDHKVILSQKINYVPNFLEQRNIGNFMSFCCTVYYSIENLGHNFFWGGLSLFEPFQGTFLTPQKVP